MGRSPCCDADANMRRGPWLTEEDEKLREYIEVNGAGNWKNLPKLAGLNRCGKSCRLRWANYLRPDIKRGRFSEEEEQLILHFHSVLGNKWSAIAARLPAGRTDNEVKNYWNTHLRKKLLNMGIDPVTHRPRTDLNQLLASVPLNLIAAAAASNLMTANPLLNALQLPQLQMQHLLQTFAQNLMGLQNLSNNLLDTTTMMPNLSMNHFGSSLIEQGVGNNGSASSSYVTTPTATTMPSLVSASPENSIVGQVQEPPANDVAVRSPTSKPLDAWDGLNLDVLDDDLDWEDILNQIHWSDAL